MNRVVPTAVALTVISPVEDIVTSFSVEISPTALIVYPDPGRSQYSLLVVDAEASIALISPIERV